MSLSLSLDMSSVHEDPAESFSSFYSSLPSLSSEWSDQTVTPLEKIHRCQCKALIVTQHSIITYSSNASSSFVISVASIHQLN